MSNRTFKRIADNIRVPSVAMPEKAKSGNPGGALGATDFMAPLGLRAAVLFEVRREIPECVGNSGDPVRSKQTKPVHRFQVDLA